MTLQDDNGPFDTNFSTYGWEDLELGERLRQRGATITHAGDAIGSVVIFVQFTQVEDSGAEVIEPSTFECL